MYDFVAIDFETANNVLYSACSVGLVAVTGNKLVKSDYFLIKPPDDYFAPQNTRINGITYDMVKDSDSFPVVYREILNYISNSRAVLAHNAHFDMSVLCNCINYYRLDVPDFIYIDTINFSAQVKCECGNSLEACAHYFNIPLENHHNALCDAEVCAKIALESINHSDASNFFEYVFVYPDINRYFFSDLRPNRTISLKKSFDSVKISDITATVTHFNENCALYGKNCVLTGELDLFSRREAMQKIVDAGGILKTSVSSKTDFLIVGKQDAKLVGDDGLSAKERKAYSLISKGATLKVLNENDFIKILSEEGLF